MGIFKNRKQARIAGADTKAKVYYSTPFGDTKAGERKLFLLERNGVPYFPVFQSVESMKTFYERTNRAAYMIIEGNIEGVVDTLRSIEPLKNAGIVIEPLSEHPVEIVPNPRRTS